MRSKRGILRPVVIGVALATAVVGFALPSGGSANPGADAPADPAPAEIGAGVVGGGAVAATETTAADTLAPLEVPDPVPPAPARVDGSTAGRGQILQVSPTLPPPPPTTTTTTTTLAPFDPTALPWFSGTGRRVVYSISAQRVWAVEADGTVVKTHVVSGKRGVPNPGTYSVFSRSMYTMNIDNPNLRWMYMIRFAKGPEGGNIGFHEIPTQCRTWLATFVGRDCWKVQTEAQLGRPLSGGCVRQSTPDAIWMWNWAPVGTKVVVVP
jgi:hypothetical protein